MRFPRMLATIGIVAAVAVLSTSEALAAPKAAPTVGYDVSYPQCGSSLPDRPAFGIVGVSDGLAYGKNPCLAAQYAWALKAPQTPAFYMNTGNPGSASTRVRWYEQTGPQACSATNESACAYDYGYNGAQQAFNYAASQTSAAAAVSATWWLDVETANSWSGDYDLNRVDIQGSIDFLRGLGIVVGIYSTSYQWGQVTNGLQLGPAVPNWVAGAANAKRAAAMCSIPFTGGTVRLVQYPLSGFDANYACT